MPIFPVPPPGQGPEPSRIQPGFPSPASLREATSQCRCAGRGVFRPVRTTALALGFALLGASCGMRTEFDTPLQTSTTTAPTVSLDAAAQAGAGLADAGPSLPTVPPVITPDAALPLADAATGPNGGPSAPADARTVPGGPEAGSDGTVRVPDASVPRADTATPVQPGRDGGVLPPPVSGDAGPARVPADSGAVFGAPDLGGTRVTRDAGLVNGREAGVALGRDARAVTPGVIDAGFVIPTQPDGGGGRQGNDARAGRTREAGTPNGGGRG
jgi:hypothetical protein